MQSHITRTGRALSPGRVTRKSKLVRTRARNQDRPLPISLQCHPKALSPTPVHPVCMTYRHASGYAIHFMELSANDTAAFATGQWLSGKGDYRVVVEGYGEFRHDDLNSALGWRMAAIQRGFTVEVYTRSNP